MSGLSISGLSMSGLIMTRSERPPGRRPPDAGDLRHIDEDLCLRIARGDVERSGSGGPAGTLTSRTVIGGGDEAVYGGSGNCSNDARPPTGCASTVMRNVFVVVVSLVANTTKPRCNVGRELLGVARSADQQAAADASGVDVLVARAGIAGMADGHSLRGSSTLCQVRPDNRGRSVVGPVAVERRAHVAVIRPRRVKNGKGRRRGRVVNPPSACRRHKCRRRRQVDVVADERNGSELEHRQVWRVDLQLLEHRRAISKAHEVVGHLDGRRECRRGPVVPSDARMSMV